jgi:hypothetical protein
MILIKSINNALIRLTSVSSPDLIQKGDFDELLAIKYFENSPLTSKYLVVIYKEINKGEK